MSEALMWLDVETTGLDPKSDYILEVGWQATTMRGDRLAYGGEYLIETDEPEDILKESCMGVVLEMHTHSGLWDDRAERIHYPLSVVCDRIVSDVNNLKKLGYKQVHLAGASVHFDRGFIDNDYGPLGVSHRHVDVSAIKLALRSIGRWDSTVTPKPMHRAFADVQAEIDEYRHLLKVMGRK